MSTSNQPPDLANELSKLKRRVDSLERQLRPLLEQFKPEIVFSYSGLLAVSESPAWTRRESGRMIEVVGRLRVAGTTATTVLVKKNNVTVVTVTIPANQLSSAVPCSVSFAADQDVLHDSLTVVGSAAEDLTVQHRFKR